MVVAWGAVCLGLFGLGVSGGVLCWGVKKLRKGDSSDDKKALRKAGEIANSETTHKIVGAVGKAYMESKPKK